MSEYYFSMEFFRRPHVYKPIYLMNSINIGNTVAINCGGEEMQRKIHAKIFDYDIKSNHLRVKVLSEGAQFYITDENEGVYFAKKVM